MLALQISVPICLLYQVTYEYNKCYVYVHIVLNTYIICISECAVYLPPTEYFSAQPTKIRHLL